MNNKTLVVKYVHIKKVEKTIGPFQTHQKLLVNKSAHYL